MFVTASSRFDADTAKAIAFLRLFGKNEPNKNKRRWVLAFGALALVLLTLIYFRGTQWHLVLFLGLDLVILWAVLQLPKLMPGVQYDKFGPLKDTESRYLFGSDRFLMTTSVEDFKIQHPVEYKDLDNIHESDDYLFFYHKEKILYVADKSTIDPEKLPQLLDTLHQAVPKYVRCEY